MSKEQVQYLDSYPELLRLTGRDPDVEEDFAGIDRFWSQIHENIIEIFPDDVDEYDITLFLVERRKALRAMYTRWHKARRVVDSV